MVQNVLHILTTPPVFKFKKRWDSHQDWTIQRKIASPFNHFHMFCSDSKQSFIKPSRSMKAIFMSFQLQIGRFHGVVDRLYALLDSDAKSILSLKEEFVKFLFTFLPWHK